MSFAAHSVPRLSSALPALLWQGHPGSAFERYYDWENWSRAAKTCNASAIHEVWEAPSEEAERVDQTLFFILFLNVTLSFPRITLPEPWCNGGRVIFWLLEIRQMWWNQKQFSGSRAPRRFPRVLVFQTEGGGAIILCQTYVGLREEKKKKLCCHRAIWK